MYTQRRLHLQGHIFRRSDHQEENFNTKEHYRSDDVDRSFFFEMPMP